MNNNLPKILVLTPVRNEAWILDAFLKATSLWADYIIIADQNSIDGSREIALRYPKVILIDNNNPNFNEAERQKLLIDRAREIPGAKILFGLDADEIFSANYKDTEDWRKILKSKPGDVFLFRWANICPNQSQYWSPKTFYPWMFHDDGVEAHGNYVRNMHSMRIPYPIEEKQMYYVNDFKVMHLAYLYPQRVEAKMRFYKFVDYELNKRSIVSLSRSYQIKEVNEKFEELPQKWLYQTDDSLTIFSYVKKEEKSWFDNYIIDHIKQKDVKEYERLDIWNVDFLHNLGIKDPRNCIFRLLHFYLRKTKSLNDNISVKIIDKFFKKIGY